MLDTGTCWYLLCGVSSPPASQETENETSLLPLGGIRHVEKWSAVGIAEEAARVALSRAAW